MGGETCWALVEGAANGDAAARERFASVYLPVVRGYLVSRWRGRRLRDEVEDAVQQVFVECLRDGGALDGARRRAGTGFRAFLYGVASNVARRFEAPRGELAGQAEEGRLAEVPAREDPASRVFDRGWARALVAEAAERQRAAARAAGAGAVRRVELLELRFSEGLPIREIARRWEVDAAEVHHAYGRARKEFREALRTVVAFHHPDSPAAAERELAQVLRDLE